jgi:hypothetical protein
MRYLYIYDGETSNAFMVRHAYDERRLGRQSQLVLTLPRRRREFHFQSLAPPRKRCTEREIKDGDKAVHKKWLKRRVRNHAAGFGEFNEADDGCECRAFDDLHEKANGRRNRDTQRLRQDDESQLLSERQRNALRRFPLSFRHGIDAAAPNLNEIRT